MHTPPLWHRASDARRRFSGRSTSDPPPAAVDPPQPAVSRAPGSRCIPKLFVGGEMEMAEATATSDRVKVKESAATLQSRAREQIDQRSTQAGEQMSSSAQALRSTSARLREEGQDGPARAAERAADQA